MLDSIDINYREYHTSELSESTILLLRSATTASFYEFVKVFWYTINDDDLRINWHIEKLCDIGQGFIEDFIEKKPSRYLNINIYPGSTKSTIFSRMLPIWGWIKDPYLCFMTVSSTYQLANERIAADSLKIMNSYLFKRVFPEYGVAKVSRPMRVLYKGQICGFRDVSGVDANVTGGHSHIHIYDDVQGAEIIYSNAERKNSTRTMFAKFPDRFKDKKRGYIINVMQRLHKEDYTTSFVKFYNAESYIFPAEENSNITPAIFSSNYKDGLCDPISLPREVLNEFKRQPHYSAKFLQMPVSSDDAIMKEDWFIDYTELPNGIIPHYVIDRATNINKETNDPTVVLCYGVYNSKIYIIDVYRDWKLMPDFLKDVELFFKSTGYRRGSLITVENKSDGVSVTANLKRMGYNAEEFKLPNMGKVQRIDSIINILMSGVVHVPLKWNKRESFMSEILSFPDGADYYDQVDCLYLAVATLPKFSMSRYIPIGG